jgi:hypothetical protein
MSETETDTLMSFHHVRVYRITTSSQAVAISLASIRQVLLMSLDNHEPLAASNSNLSY